MAGFKKLQVLHAGPAWTHRMLHCKHHMVSWTRWYATSYACHLSRCHNLSAIETWTCLHWRKVVCKLRRWQLVFVMELCIRDGVSAPHHGVHKTSRWCTNSVPYSSHKAMDMQRNHPIFPHTDATSMVLTRSSHPLPLP